MVNSCVLCSLREVLYQKRMQRELARARGEMGASERPPEEVHLHKSNLICLEQSCLYLHILPSFE